MNQSKTAFVDPVLELQDKIKSWSSQTPEQIKALKEEGITLKSYQEALKLYLTTSQGGPKEIKPDSPFLSKWDDLRDYIQLIIVDLKRSTSKVPELDELVNFFTSSLINIETKSFDNKVLKLLKAQLMLQLYNISTNRFLQKHDKLRTTNQDDLAPDQLPFNGQPSQSEKLIEHENTRAKYTVISFDDIQALDDMLFALDHEPSDFKTTAGKAIVARLAFRNNLSYIKAEAGALPLQKECIEKFKTFQNLHYITWAGNPSTGESRTKNINFYMSLIKLWEARALFNLERFEEAEESAKQVKNYSPTPQLLNEVKALLDAIKYGDTPTVEENQAIFA